MSNSLKTIVLLFLLTNIFIAQNNESTSNGFLTKQWIYPDLADELLKPFVIEDKINQSCQVLPPDSLRTFGNIRGMGCDRSDNLYVWDDGYQALWKFNSVGQKVWRRKYKKGTGNGEFTKVGPAFCVSRDGSICIGDRISKTITLLDSSGEFRNKISIDMWPGSIAIGLDETIYVEGFQMSYKGNLIQHYSRNGNLINSFCERKDTSFIARFSGNSGRLSIDSDGYIYYAHFYPYQVDKFSKDGDLIQSIDKTTDEFVKPSVDKGIVVWTSGLRGIMNSPNGYSLIFVVIDDNINNWGLDVLDKKFLTIKHISKDQFPRKFWYRCSTTDSKGNIYFDLYTDSGPVIIKYKIAETTYSK